MPEHRLRCLQAGQLAAGRPGWKAFPWDGHLHSASRQAQVVGPSAPRVCSSTRYHTVHYTVRQLLPYRVT